MESWVTQQEPWARWPVSHPTQLHPCLSPFPPAKNRPVSDGGVLDFRIIVRIHVTLGMQRVFRAGLQAKATPRSPWETVLAATTHPLLALMVLGVATSWELISHSTSAVLRGSGCVWCGEEVCRGRNLKCQPQLVPGGGCPQLGRRGHLQQ